MSLKTIVRQAPAGVIGVGIGGEHRGGGVFVLHLEEIIKGVIRQRRRAPKRAAAGVGIATDGSEVAVGVIGQVHPRLSAAAQAAAGQVAQGIKITADRAPQRIDDAGDVVIAVVAVGQRDIVGIGLGVKAALAVVRKTIGSGNIPG